jgi:hypothetical protein
MDTLIIQGKFKKFVSTAELEKISVLNHNLFNRNINWILIKEEFELDSAKCLVVPILIHQHHKGRPIFPHFRCHIVIDGISHILLQDISFEQWGDF